MNKPHPIPGTWSLEEIQGAIQTTEVKRNKLVGVAIEDNINQITFEHQNVPPRAQLVLAGASAPPGTSLSWTGKMRVAGKNVDVQLYRGASAFAAEGQVQSQIEQVQSALSLKVDGAPGPRTWEAIAKALELPAIQTVELADKRSEATIATLLPHVRPFARALFFKAKARGISMSLISGTRSFAEQDALFAIGRTTGRRGKVVTNARGGQSNHNFGIGFDVGVFKDKKYLEDAGSYLAVGVLGEELGLEWGGRWKRFPDASHFQLRPAWAAGMSEKAMIARLRDETPHGVEIAEAVLVKLSRQKKVGDLCQC